MLLIKSPRKRAARGKMTLKKFCQEKFPQRFSIPNFTEFFLAYSEHEWGNLWMARRIKIKLFNSENFWIRKLHNSDERLIIIKLIFAFRKFSAGSSLLIKSRRKISIAEIEAMCKQATWNKKHFAISLFHLNIFLWEILWEISLKYFSRDFASSFSGKALMLQCAFVSHAKISFSTQLP